MTITQGQKRDFNGKGFESPATRPSISVLGGRVHGYHRAARQIMHLMTRLLLIPDCILACMHASALPKKPTATSPSQLEADRITVDDVNKVHVLEGRVILTKGTMQLKAEKLVVTQNADGFPERRRHRRGQWPGTTSASAAMAAMAIVEGEAERIEYDDRSERTDSVQPRLVEERQRRGHAASSSAMTRGLKTTPSLIAAAARLPGSDGRVRAVIQPRNSMLQKKTPRRSAAHITLPAAGRSQRNNNKFMSVKLICATAQINGLTAVKSSSP